MNPWAVRLEWAGSLAAIFGGIAGLAGHWWGLLAVGGLLWLEYISANILAVVMRRAAK